MKIEAVKSFIPDILNGNKIEKQTGDNFGNVLTDFIGQVNQNQLDANKVTKEFIEGGNIEIQDVMIAGEKAKTSLDLLMEIRNKTIDMYKQLTNMPV